MNAVLWQAAVDVNPGDPSKVRADIGVQKPGGDTVYLCAVDGEGNACSFINSNYEGFGSGQSTLGMGPVLYFEGKHGCITVSCTVRPVKIWKRLWI